MKRGNGVVHKTQNIIRPITWIKTKIAGIYDNDASSSDDSDIDAQGSHLKRIRCRQGTSLKRPNEWHFKRKPEEDVACTNIETNSEVLSLFHFFLLFSHFFIFL